MKNYYKKMLSSLTSIKNKLQRNSIPQRKIVKYISLAMFLPLISFGQQTGDLDLSFSIDGMQTVSTSNSLEVCRAIAIQSDGKIVAVGSSNNGANDDFSIVRFNSDGSIDNTFNGNGIQITDLGNTYDYAQALAIQSDGKIVVGGASNGDFALVRYNSDGSLDNTFNGTGVQTTDLSNDDYGYGVTLQANGKIILVGNANTSTGTVDLTVLRYNVNGSLDSTFNGTGIQTTNFTTYSSDFGNDVKVQADGKIVVAGYTQTFSNYEYAVVRYNSDGSLDNSFDSDGIQTTAMGVSIDIAFSLAIQTDGKIIIAGRTGNGSSASDFGLVRYNTNGSLDLTFSGDGIQTTDFGFREFGKAITLQPDGKFIVVGSTDYFGSDDFAIARYNTDGSLDLSFSGDGKQTTSFSSIGDAASSVAIQSDGRIVVAGYSNNNGVDNEFAIARYFSGLITEIEEPANNDQISTTIFPNPFDRETKLKLIGTSQFPSTLIIYNTLGQIVHSQIINTNESSLELSLTNGIYTYTIASETGKLYSRGKLLIEHN
ncbi:MAG: T9SS type A sorting domain-containing protein [Bacteroidota bacterium]|jgi:uncharacterized delta-60 repeat protein